MRIPKPRSSESQLRESRMGPAMSCCGRPGCRPRPWTAARPPATWPGIGSAHLQLIRPRGRLLARIEVPMRFHHVGVAVDDLDVAIEMYTKHFGAELTHRAKAEDQGLE